MFFITNHAREGSQGSEDHETVFVFDEDNNDVGMSFYCCQVGPEGRHKEILSKHLFKRLALSGCNQILFYAHGFNTQPSDALRRGLELQILFDKATEKPGEVAVVPLIWPNGDRAGILGRYVNDQQRADASSYAFSRVLQAFAEWSEARSRANEPPCTIRLNVLAHSMGARLLRGSLLRWQKDFLGSGVPMLFRHVFLAAADVVNETMSADEEGEIMRHAAQDVTVYFAASDLALRASKAINVRTGIASRRLGHTGPLPFTADMQNVVAVDCDDFAEDYEHPNAHNYFSSAPSEGEQVTAGVLFEHMARTLETGRVVIAQGSRRLILSEEGNLSVA